MQNLDSGPLGPYYSIEEEKNGIWFPTPHGSGDLQAVTQKLVDLMRDHSGSKYRILRQQRGITTTRPQRKGCC